ncbi:F xylanase [Coprinopsis cinerea okayama7|uniref:Beta-xylanase n=1 Tax=Coprinopsis cinerea (strain Okayama-7 / 130 / ATCC MYA-4618 / FGSC 9003) TaxID=240176 RepID=A8NBS7_COPC7|nr:F xylanase [Coprinopsis cinerea okayama7\|eukprot:XP_001832275.2 F xylanase [Coprinopsis cinerea okayama7\
MQKLLALVAFAVSNALRASAVGPYGQCGGNGYTGSPGTAQPPVTQPQPPVTTQPPPVTTQPPITTLPPITTQPPATGPPKPSASAGGLQDKFGAKGKLYFGACADPNTLNIAANVDVLKKDFGQVTPENSMKWDATEPNRGSFNYGNADRLVNWAVENGKLIRGHTLVWHSQLPGWVNNINDRATLTTVIENHISNLAGRYAGKLYASFVAVAFQAARKADPKAVLYINDYNLDSDNAKVRGMVNLVNRVNQANPGTVDGMGTQMHLGPFQPKAGGSGGAQAALNALARTVGIKEVAITELDIQQASANDYTTVVRACLNTPLCIGITVWGVSDANSWRSNTNPLLFDGQFRPKAAYTAIINML